jgi:hypothetical protein
MLLRSTLSFLALSFVLTAAPAGATVFSDAEQLCQFMSSTVSGATTIVPNDASGSDDCAALCDK